MNGTVTAMRTPHGRHLEALLGQLRTWQDLPDVAHILVALAAAVVADGNDARPVWVLIVAPPSSGKTETVRLLDDIAAEHLDEVTIGGLLTWARKGKRACPAGVLTRVRHGLLTFGDLSTLLATSDRGGRDQVFAALRRVYDGEFSRDIAPPGGADTAETLTWSGEITVVGAVTNAIDNYAAHANALGSRWLYVRLPERDLESRRRAARRTRGQGLGEHRGQARGLASAAVHAARRQLGEVEVSDDLADALDEAAIVCAYGRGSVPRNGYGKREIEGPAEIEDPGRLTGVLHNLARGLLALGLDEQTVLDVCNRAALDSMPAVRGAVLRVLAGAERGAVTTAAVARSAGLDRGVARRALEEFEMIGVVGAIREGREAAEEERDARPCRWFLRGSEGEAIRKVVKSGGGCSEVWEPPTTTPQDQETPKKREQRDTSHGSAHPREVDVKQRDPSNRRSNASHELVTRIARERAAGTSYRAIAAGLMADGISTPTGKPRWYPGSVQSVLTSEAGAAALAEVQVTA